MVGRTTCGRRADHFIAFEQEASSVTLGHDDEVNTCPESLAYRISLWEAWSRKHGWRVDTPRIPGLDYPTWDELDRG